MNKKSKLIIHIGTGKTATTFLQKKIFPELQKLEQVIYLEKNLIYLKTIFSTFRVLDDLNNLDLNKKIQDYRSSIKSSLKKYQKPHIISAEWLHGWDPDMWEQLLLLNKFIFSGLADSVEIMITFRSTRPYLDSIYNQLVHTGDNPKSPKNFYLDKESYRTAAKFFGNSSKGSEIFCLDKLLYKDLFNYYAKSFSKTFAFTMNEVLNLEFIKELNICDEKNFNSLYQILLEPIDSVYIHKSYSLIALKLTYIREKILNNIGLKSFSSLDSLKKIGFKVIGELTSHHYPNVDKIKNISDLKAKKLSPLLNILLRIWNKFFNRIKKSFIWRNIMQNFVNNFFEYQKSKYEYDFFTNFKKIEKENEDFLNLNIKKRIL